MYEKEALWYWARMLRDTGRHQRANEKLDELSDLYSRTGHGQPWIDLVNSARP